MIVLNRMVIGVACAILMQLDTPPTEASVTPENKAISLRNEVREIIRPKCGSCHTSTLSTAKPKAVAIYDLAKEDWPNTISAKQFEGFKKRLNDFSDSQKQKIEKFIAQELKDRPSPSHRHTQ